MMAWFVLSMIENLSNAKHKRNAAGLFNDLLLYM